MKKGCGFLVFCCVLSALVFFSTVISAQQGTVIGTVYSNYEIEADDGTVYLVVADDKGEELMLLDGARARVTGIIDEINGEYAITVTSFSELAELPLEESIVEEPLEEEFPENMEEQ
ncbi:MAG TPA: hypothetical protein ENN05_03275 [Deltaproteobacteria bacterium]|nr:hypothetical protein [Deltaproteobacteria bacterium]